MYVPLKQFSHENNYIIFYALLVFVNDISDNFMIWRVRIFFETLENSMTLSQCAWSNHGENFLWKKNCTFFVNKRLTNSFMQNEWNKGKENYLLWFQPMLVGLSLGFRLGFGYLD